MLIRRPRCASLLLASVLVLLASPPAFAQTPVDGDVLAKLLLILKDRGSITPAEYDELRLLAAGSTPAPAPPPDRAVVPPAIQTREGAAGVNAQKGNAEPSRPAPAPKWYDRIGLRGYTQFRLTETFSGVGEPVEVPADRSVNDGESFMIRRGRFVLSGDLSDHVALYAQSDFNGSTGAPDFSVQMRDLYADIAFDKAKTFRVRVGQSKVPFGFVNMQSSQNRAPIERPDALNSAVEGERDLGAYMMWAPARTRQLFRDLVSRGLKGSGDYGVVTVGAYGGQGLNRSDQNGQLHWLARATYPFTLASKQIVEFSVQGYTGKFVVPTQANSIAGASVTPTRPAEGQTDHRVAVSAIWYPQPLGFEAEWNIGTGPVLSDDGRSIETDRVNGGYLQLHYRHAGTSGTWFPFTRWQYFDGGRKFARNAPRNAVNEVDLGLEFSRWADVELTLMYTHTLKRLRTSTYPYGAARDAERVGVQVQWNY